MMGRTAVAAGLWALALVLAPPANAAEVVVNASLNQFHVHRAFLRGMFGMRLRAWPDGAPVTVFVLPDANGVHAEFCTDVLQVFPYQLRQNWDRLVYSGTGQPPVEVASEDELLRRVAATPGALGYIGSRRLAEARAAEARLAEAQAAAAKPVKSKSKPAPAPAGPFPGALPEGVRVLDVR